MGAGGATMPSSDPKGSMNPGDEAEPGTPGTGEDVCPACHGTGTLDSKPCQECGGTGKITRAIGGG